MGGQNIEPCWVSETIGLFFSIIPGYSFWNHFINWRWQLRCHQLDINRHQLWADGRNTANRQMHANRRRHYLPLCRRQNSRPHPGIQQNQGRSATWVYLNSCPFTHPFTSNIKSLSQLARSVYAKVFMAKEIGFIENQTWPCISVVITSVKLLISLALQALIWFL